MKRQNYSVTLTRADGAVISKSVKFAMNSAITESERLVREFVRGIGTVANGLQPIREGDLYSRTWIADNYGTLIATVQKY